MNFIILRTFQLIASYRRLFGLKMPLQQVEWLLFSALPGGNRNNNGTFNNIGNNGYWWSSTENDATNAWNRKLNYNNSNINRNNNNKAYGFSVRCVRALMENKPMWKFFRMGF